MKHERWLAAAVLAALALPLGSATAAPIDTWQITHGIDCVGDKFNPIRPDGTRNPSGDPLPGTPEWTARDSDLVNCSKQRDHDRRVQPADRLNTARYGEDWYRQPVRFDGRRFRYTYLPSSAIPGSPNVPAAELYRPCAPFTCPTLPAGLQRFSPPYPVVVIHHGFIAQMTHHRWNAHVFAEHGYMAISVNGIHPLTGVPNVQSNANGDAILDWLASPASGIYGQEADLNRVAFVGHSQGSAAALSYQGDPRVHAIIAWDGGDGIADDNCTLVLDPDGNPTGELNPCAPIMYQRTDGAFASAQNAARADYPTNRERALPTYNSHKARNIDVFHLTARATAHVDWVGYGSGLGGNRLAEPFLNYYNLAWLDRHLTGKLVFDANGDVVTSGGRTEAEERAYRQARAEDAFRRLIAKKFDDSADIHNVSMGFFDPVQLAESGNPLYGGNVPYKVEGLWTTDRFSPYFRSVCSVSVPDYVNGGNGKGGVGADGTPIDPVASARRADTTADGDMRFIGCAEI